MIMNIRSSWIILLLILLLQVMLSTTLTSDNPTVSFTQNTKQKLKILGAFSHPGKSHFELYKPLLEELARRGHELTVISHFPRNIHKKDVEILPTYKDISIAESSQPLVAVKSLSTLVTSSLKIVDSKLRLRSFAIQDCRAGLNVPKVRELINSDEKFDLMITENFNSDCFLGFIHRFQVPFISIVSDIQPQVNYIMGNPDNPSFIAGVFTDFSTSMTFFQRVLNTIYVVTYKIFYEIGVQWYIQEIVGDVFGPGVPPLTEIAKNTSVVMTNTHYSIFGARPFVPNVVEIGGIHILPQKPLPEDIQQFLDGAPEGVLLFSWGSMVKTSSLPKEKLDVILKVIGGIPRKVIWKWEMEDLEEKPKNLMIMKWLPQFDIMSEYEFGLLIRIWETILE